MKVSKFRCLYSKEAEKTIEMREWVDAIRSGEYKQTVEQIRSLLAEGKKEEASELKLKLPAVTFAGVCSRGRYYRFMTERTGDGMFDMDNMTQEQLKAARELLEVFPWIVMLHVTSSGKGLRIVVNMGKVHIDVYRDAYERVAARLNELTGISLDMQCKDFARASLASYDPDIYFNPDATVFDYGDESSPLNYVPVNGPDPSEDFRIPSAVFAHEQEEEKKYNNNVAVHGAANAGTSADGPEPRQVIERFFSTNNYTEGSRHNTLLRLGGYMRWRGVDSCRLDEAVALACSRAVEPGITEKEVRAAVIWGYNHGSEGGKKTSGSVQNAQNVPMSIHRTENFAVNADYEENKTEEEDEEDVINESCSALDDELFEHLPEEMKRLLVIAKDRRERDIILLSSIAVMSGMFPALRTTYGNQKYSAHMYICFVADAGAGKGQMMLATLLASKTNLELEKMYRKVKKEYEAKLLEWELEVRNAIKDRRMPDTEMKPEEPGRQMLLLSPNTSKSQMIRDMKSSGEEGVIMITPEIDAMADALSMDYGKVASELRMFFHHEEVRQNFKVDKEPIVVENPRMAILMAGTPNQAVSFFKTTENGLYSRFLFYMMNADLKWKSQSPLDGNGGIDAKELFGNLGEKLKTNFFSTRGKEVTINFTRRQWDRHNEVFDMEMSVASAEEKSNAGAMVVRTGLIVIRIAMVLCGLRIMEAGWQVTEYTCTDEDFDTAMKIGLNGLAHSANVSTMLNNRAERKKLDRFYKFLPVLKGMKNQFRYYEFRDAVVNTGASVSSSRRALKKYVENGLLTNSYGLYTKTKKLKRMLI